MKEQVQTDWVKLNQITMVKGAIKHSTWALKIALHVLNCIYYKVVLHIVTAYINVSENHFVGFWCNDGD